MTTVSYPAIICKDDIRLSVFFPDVPGCFTDGDTIEEATVNAKEALTQHLSAAAKEDVPINPPSALSDVKPEEGDEEVSRILVEVIIP